MKRYIVAAKKILKIGDCVEIKGNSFHAGDWGIIVDICEEDNEYFVAMFGDKSDVPVFSRDELKLLKYRPKGV